MTTEAKTATADEVNAARAAGEEIDGDAKYYCPGCGQRYDDQGTCTGTPVAPHGPIAVVSTKELSGDAEKHTAAPNTGD